jgi:O-antigen/teichoic acid export membrane protein
MSIVEVFLKLIIVYILVVFDFDKLILYAGLLFLVSFIVRSAHKIYCKIYFEESKYQFFYDKEMYKKLIAYSGWNLFGNIAAVARGQGINILLNLFFGTVLNAAYGITVQVQTVVNIFVTNFQLAVNPQIIKNYAQGNIEQSRNLILQSAKFSYFLMFLIVSPILFNIEFVLKIWLQKPPEYTSIFISLSLINLLIDCISGPLMIGAQATGNIKWYQIIVGALVFLNLPIAYVLLRVYKVPELVFYTSILISGISLLFRIYFIKSCLNLSFREFIVKVIFRIVLVSISAILSFLFLNKYTFFMNDWLQFIVKSFAFLLIVTLSILMLGLNKQEKRFIKDFF